jgi:hypothetical protein
VEALKEKCNAFLEKYKKSQSYVKYWTCGYPSDERLALIEQLEDVVAYLSNSQVQLVINKTADFPILDDMLFCQPLKNSKLGLGMVIFFPVGLVGYLIGHNSQKTFKQELQQTVKVCDQLLNLL